MRPDPRPVREADLHGFVDGQLDPARRLDVERHLAAHPDIAARVEHWIADAEALRTAFATREAATAPASLALLRSGRERPRWRLAGMAAGLAFLLGGGLGWALRGPGVVMQVTAVGLQAAAAQRVFSRGTLKPVEFGPARVPVLDRWASRQIGRPVTAPDLADMGFHLLGGRMTSGVAGPGCLFFYEDDRGTRITLLLQTMPERTATAPMQAVRTAEAAGFAWARNGVGFGLVSAPDEGVSRGFADQLRSRLDEPA